MFSDEDLLQLSAIQHFIFCPRQCALIHIEQIWAENMFTAEGRVMHDKAHEETFEMRDGIRIERGVSLRSLRLGLSGKADVLEFHRSADGLKWLPFPVEYKRGKPKADDCDVVQLCAQALCLEEMMEIEIPAGAIFYGKIRRRHDVAFTKDLRIRTEEAASRLHEFLSAGLTPRPAYGPKCESCSFLDVCMPGPLAAVPSVNEYFSKEMGVEKTS